MTTYLKDNNVEALELCDVLDIKTINETEHEVICKHKGKNITYKSKYVIVAPGRTGAKWVGELAEKYNLRPGMGLAAIQLGIKKRYIVIVHEVDDGVFDEYVVINPKIVSSSKEKIYVEDGEGCLSVNRETEGIVPRAARVTVEGYDIDGNKISIRAREELAIVFQHEIDHLNGIIFYDRINKKMKTRRQQSHKYFIIKYCNTKFTKII